MAREPRKPFLFLRRGLVWTIVYYDTSGKKRQQATPCRGPEKREKAEGILREFARDRERDARAAGESDTDGPMTVSRWAKAWLATRTAKGVSMVSDYRSRMDLYVLPLIGWMRIDAVKPDNIADVVASVMTKDLAPRTQRHIYDAMTAMFKKAIPRYIGVNPCSLDTEDLPRRKDADPEWRANAIFTKAEVQVLLTDPRIPLYRRVFYAVMFLAGMRFGEISALRVRHYLPDMLPLGQLQVGLSFNSNRRVVKETKTETPRQMPVHPWLERILGHWLAVGWAELMGREPTRDDLLLPNTRGTHRKKSTGYQLFQADLVLLGFRKRRQHDSRHTFITHAIADGAIKSILRLGTHGKEGDIMDSYSQMPWGALCAEVTKLNIGPPPVPPLSSVANSAESHVGAELSGCHQVATSEKTSDSASLRADRTSRRSRGDGSDSDGHAAPTTDSPHDCGTFDLASRLTVAVTAGQLRPMATLATLALRQALAALDRGRLDQVRQILERAIEEETKSRKTTHDVRAVSA